MSNSNMPDGELFLATINRYVPEVMQTMVGITANPASGNSKAPQPTSLVGVTGSIGLSGKVNGMVYTAFSYTLAQQVAEKILGGSASDQDVSDVVAELTNMITGNLKSQLCDMGFNCSLSIPSVVRGDDIQVSAKTASISVKNEYILDGYPDFLVVQVFAALEH
jgi:chemotaxis protein CheX